MRLPAMPSKNSDGLGVISTITRRPSNCSERFLTNAGQCSAPGISSFSAAIIWQPLQAPSANVSRRAKNCSNSARTEHVAVGKSAARGKALEPRQRGAAGDEVGHVDVDRLEAGAVERRRHLDMAVHALLPKNCDTGANAGRRSDVFLLKSQMHREARILGIDDAVEF